MNRFFEDTNSNTNEGLFTDVKSSNAFMGQVYTTMSIGLFLTAVASWLISQNEAAMNFLYSGIMFYVTLFAPLAFVILLSSRINKMSFATASLTFGTYSIVTGISLAFIFWIYPIGTIYKVFLITAGTFGAMSVIGYTTQIDLSQYKSYLYMGLIGIIIAMVVNLFFQSPMMDYIISIIGVLVFCGLTAYDTQKLMRIGAHADPELESTKKVALMGALTLYLDFINLFLFLLRIFGGGRD